MERSRPPTRRGSLALLALLALVLVPLLVEGCATSLMTNMWMDPSYSEGTMKNVLAVAVRKDPVRRRIWEDALVDELKSYGVTAVSSYSLFPAETPDTLEVTEAVRKHAFDGVAVSVHLAKVTEETYVPGYIKSEPVYVSRPFSRAFRTYWRDVEVPGYTETTEVRRFQTDVWTTRNGGRLIWSGTLESTNAASYGSVQEAIAKGILPELSAAGVLPPKTD
jgi:hypothetical protein